MFGPPNKIPFKKNKKFHQGYFKPINSSKYIGNEFPIFRSGIELLFFKFCDKNSNIIKWSSEKLKYSIELNISMLKINDDTYLPIMGIYLIKNLINKKEYIGKSVDIKRRMSEHSTLNKSTIQHAIKKYGIENFQVYCEYFPEKTESEVLDLEKSMILQYNTLAPQGYNICEGGLGISEYIHTEKTKQIISENHTGKNNHFYGKTHSPATKLKISIANYGKKRTIEQRKEMGKKLKGIPRTDEVKHKISQKVKGLVRSEETRKHISDGHLGQIPWNKGMKGVCLNFGLSMEARNKIRVANIGKKRPTKIILQKSIDGILIQEYCSLRMAEKNTGINRQSISNACKTSIGICDGFKWEYKLTYVS